MPPVADHFGSPELDLKRFSAGESAQREEYLINNISSILAEVHGIPFVVEWQITEKGLVSQGFTYKETSKTVGPEYAKLMLEAEKILISGGRKTVVLISRPEDNLPNGSSGNPKDSYFYAYLFKRHDDTVTQLCLRFKDLEDIENFGLLPKGLYFINESPDHILRRYTSDTLKTIHDLKEYLSDVAGKVRTAFGPEQSFLSDETYVEIYKKATSMKVIADRKNFHHLNRLLQLSISFLLGDTAYNFNQEARNLNFQAFTSLDFDVSSKDSKALANVARTNVLFNENKAGLQEPTENNPPTIYDHASGTKFSKKMVLNLNTITCKADYFSKKKWNALGYSISPETPITRSVFTSSKDNNAECQKKPFSLSRVEKAEIKNETIENSIIRQSEEILNFNDVNSSHSSTIYWNSFYRTNTFPFQNCPMTFHTDRAKSSTTLKFDYYRSANKAVGNEPAFSSETEKNYFLRKYPLNGFRNSEVTLYSYYLYSNANPIDNLMVNQKGGRHKISFEERLIETVNRAREKMQKISLQKMKRAFNQTNLMSKLADKLKLNHQVNQLNLRRIAQSVSARAGKFRVGKLNIKTYDIKTVQKAISYSINNKIQFRRSAGWQAAKKSLFSKLVKVSAVLFLLFKSLIVAAYRRRTFPVGFRTRSQTLNNSHFKGLRLTQLKIFILLTSFKAQVKKRLSIKISQSAYVKESHRKSKLNVVFVKCSEASRLEQKKCNLSIHQSLLVISRLLVDTLFGLGLKWLRNKYLSRQRGSSTIVRCRKYFISEGKFNVLSLKERDMVPLLKQSCSKLDCKISFLRNKTPEKKISELLRSRLTRAFSRDSYKSLLPEIFIHLQSKLNDFVILLFLLLKKQKKRLKFFRKIYISRYSMFLDKKSKQKKFLTRKSSKNHGCHLVGKGTILGFSYLPVGMRLITCKKIQGVVTRNLVLKIENAP
ncbi:MAG: hypothetical protein NZT61_03615 [Deltaproteobacteria bacterium]|nr:hypothetical protein [Deltaproteobacteria bacterium]